MASTFLTLNLPVFEINKNELFPLHIFSNLLYNINKLLQK
jgi:hypothetical protein